MPGIGKTRFARGAASHLMNERLRNGMGVDVAAAAVAMSIWGSAEADKTKLVKDLWLASTDHRNFRIACNTTARFVPENAVGIKRYAPALILTHWVEKSMRRRLGAPVIEEIAQQLSLILPQSNCDVATALDIIGNENAVIVNIDEAHYMKAEILGMLVHELLLPLTQNGRRLFLVLSGVVYAHFSRVSSASGILVRHITLPLLKIEHMQAILIHVLRGTSGGTSDTADAAMVATSPAAVAAAPPVSDADYAMTVDALVHTVKMTEVLWWLGGVPRMLARYLLEAAKGGWSTWRLLRKHLETMPMPVACGIVHSVAHDVYAEYIKSVTSGAVTSGAVTSAVTSGATEIIRKLIILAVSERPVERAQLLGTLISGSDVITFTVETAENHQLLYWQETERLHFGIVRIPPLWLLSSGTHATPGETTTYLLQTLAGVMSPSDNEMLVPVARLCKFRAAQICGAESISSLELGYPTGAENLLMSVPAATTGPIHNIASATERVSSRTFRRVLNDLWDDARRPIIFISPPQSSFGDSSTTTDTKVEGITIPVTHHVQEKQVTGSRAFFAIGKPVPRTSVNMILREYKKVEKAMDEARECGEKATFMYVTDRLPPCGALPAALRDTYVVGVSDMPRVIGSLLATLRAFALWPHVVCTFTDEAMTLAHERASDRLVGLANTYFGRLSSASSGDDEGGAGEEEDDTGEDVTVEDGEDYKEVVPISKAYALRSRGPVT